MIEYKCPFTDKIILTIYDISTLRYLNGKTFCPHCKEEHAIQICPRKVSKE